jgi:Uma2 family endonuclease
MTTLTVEKPISLEEFLKLKETEPASEYFDNQIIQKPMPQGKHSLIQGELVTTINSVTKSKKIALALPELRCTFGGKSIVPDVVVLTYDHISQDENGDISNIISTAPDWIIEILSPDQNHSKVIKKILWCLKHGCQLGWLIDPEEKTIFAYFPQQKIAYFETEKDILPLPEFIPELEITLGQIFSWLKI